MTRQRLGAIVGIALILSAVPAITAAQVPVPLFLIEGNLGLALPSGPISERWGVGLSTGAAATVRPLPYLGFYVGYSRAFFDLDFLDDLHAVDSGFATGWTGTLPLSQGRLQPWISAGLLLHKLKLMDYQGTVRAGDGQRGFEVGAGGAVALPHGSLPLGLPGHGGGFLPAVRCTRTRSGARERLVPLPPERGSDNFLSPPRLR